MTPNTGKTTDFALFLSLWNTIQKQDTPPIHFSIAMWLQDCWARGETRLLLQAFRASGKSTIAGLFCAWRLMADPDSRFLILSAESTLACRMVRNIRKVIERHPLTTRLKPKKTDQWGNDRFTVRRARELRDPSVIGQGITGNITGTRAVVIICDDVEVPNTCDTAEKRRALREVLAEAEFILPPQGRMIYLGTPHCWNTIYAGAPRAELGETEPFLKNYTRLSIPILNAQGTSAWPERYGTADMAAIRARTGPNKFASQMMLTPVNVTEARLDPALLRRYEGEVDYREAGGTAILTLAGRRMASCSAWWDPAFGRAGGDASVLAVVYANADGEYWLHRVEYLKTDGKGEQDEATAQCRAVAAIARDLHIPAVAVETNGIGAFLPAILRREMGMMHVPCAVLEKSSARAKDKRILEAFDTVLAARALNVHACVYQTPLIAEMQDWRPGVPAGRDDGLDAVAGALSLEPIRIRRAWNPARLSWNGGGGRHTAKTDFEV